MCIGYSRYHWNDWSLKRVYGPYGAIDWTSMRRRAKVFLSIADVETWALVQNCLFQKYKVPITSTPIELTWSYVSQMHIHTCTCKLVIYGNHNCCIIQQFNPLCSINETQPIKFPIKTDQIKAHGSTITNSQPLDHIQINPDRTFKIYRFQSMSILVTNQIQFQKIIK